MNSPGDHFLARAALSDDKYGYIGRRDLGNDAFKG